ncbi:MAG: ATP-dependent DNA helicase RecG, partial [Patescibacteria group bacterium]
YIIRQAIPLAVQIPDWMPIEVKRKAGLLSLADALKLIHFPRNQKDIEKAKLRLSFDELFLIQLQSQLMRREMDQSIAPRIRFFENETREFAAGLPFTLTDAQRKTAWEILKDLEKERPMARLLSGDVGSGKTVVAMIAMLNCALNGKQAVLMVPTEILANQHYETTKNYFKGQKFKVGIATKSEKKLDADIVIGTHALIQEKISFKNLGLAIIDEQHRFGVEQRKALIERSSAKGISKNFSPHFLSMTATPIPRSLALALYGELDVSEIREMPKGRKRILTRIVPEEKREAAYGFIRQKIKEGRQVFVICPLIDPSDKLGVKSVKVEFEKLDKHIFPDLKIGLLHGRMKSKEKEKVMGGFLKNEVKILVSTSVIEVGIDYPNAVIMMVEGADRFGLAQLHQFRGRVGRGEHESYCFLFTDSSSEKTLLRLEAMARTNDGFELAKMDLKFRGPGEVYGTAQKGFPELKMASLFDYQLMRDAKTEAEKLIGADASLNKWPLLKAQLGEWEKSVHME